MKIQRRFALAVLISLSASVYASDDNKVPNKKPPVETQKAPSNPPKPDKIPERKKVDSCRQSVCRIA